MTASSVRRRHKRKLKSEINVVPYIDVMLVLLVIFMITAPLLNLGVDVDLPNSNARSISAEVEPVVVTVYGDGSYGLTVSGDAQPQRMGAEALLARVSALRNQNAKVPVLVAGQGDAPYQQVMDAIDLLSRAKVDKVSLLTTAKGAK
ncbi:MAG: Tol biopolymer transport system, TolR protein [uncultured Lysobacter sp.]|uniref:Tol-Pal system protein TolR n=1 Tax=uncultured Lysobacter sp. TaxID=271060 RepID=A0A6J4L851_9GAMM|nr:MAG: Tol biopolymer transport system, TolR protein [uncultured Lysobacter sp.]